MNDERGQGYNKGPRVATLPGFKPRHWKQEQVSAPVSLVFLIVCPITR